MKRLNRRKSEGPTLIDIVIIIYIITCLIVIFFKRNNPALACAERGYFFTCGFETGFLVLMTKHSSRRLNFMVSDTGF